MANIQVNGKYKSVRIAATIVRCRCGNPARVHPDGVCPLGEKIALGTIAYRHQNPLRTLLFGVRRKVFELTHPELYRS